MNESSSSGSGGFPHQVPNQAPTGEASSRVVPPGQMPGDRVSPSAYPNMHPGDDLPPGAPGGGEDICPVCNGSGRVQGAPCHNCGGTGKVIESVSGGP